MLGSIAVVRLLYAEISVRITDAQHSSAPSHIRYALFSLRLLINYLSRNYSSAALRVGSKLKNPHCHLAFGSVSINQSLFII